MKSLILNIITELNKGRSVLLDMAIDCKYMLDEICEKAEASQLINFEGTEKGVFYHSEYTSPCNEFKEIKRIILAINTIKGLRQEFFGILMIDITEWLDHENENYFSILLKFLYDKNNYWKYVFVIADSDARKKEHMYQQLLTIFRCSAFSCKSRGIDIVKEIIDKTAGSENVIFEPAAKNELAVCCDKNSLSGQMIENLVLDIICETPTNVIKVNNIQNYFEHPSCIYCNLNFNKKEKEGSIVRV